MATKWEINKAVRGSTLPAPSRLIMLTLSDIAEAGTAEIPERRTPSLSVLARETGLGRSTIAEHLDRLERGGWITRSRPDVAAARSKGDRTCYRLTKPEGAELVQETDYQGAEVVQETDQGGPGAGLASPGDGLDLVQELDGGSPGAGHSNYQDDQNNQETTKDTQLPLAGLADFDSADTAKKTKRKAKTKPPPDPEANPDFMKWWGAYPYKANRPAGYSAWQKATTKIAPDVLLAKTIAYADAYAASGKAARYIPMPSTWLNGERWNDPLPTRAAPSANGHQPYRNPEDPSIYEGDL